MTKHFLFPGFKIILVLVLFLVGCTATATSPASQPVSVEDPNSQIPIATALPEVPVGVVVVKVLNIREGAGTSYPIISSLNEGEKFYILGEVTNSTNNKWLLISLPNNSFGWVIGDQSYVTVQKETVDSDTYLTWQRNVEAAKPALVTPTPSP